MPKLTALFSATDKISDTISNISQAGMDMVEQFERAGDIASASFDGIEGSAASVVSSVDGVATSISDIAEQADHWTSAADNYSKSALEAMYSTEELVDMGLKSADALQEQEQMMDLCEQSSDALTKSMEAAVGIQRDLSAAMDTAAETAEKMANNEDVSAEAKTALAKASSLAAEAMDELTAAQKESADAMQAYEDVMASGTTDLTQLETAAERAGHAAESLAEANGKASDATEELSKATEKAAEEAEKSGDKGNDAITSIVSALAAAGIADKLKDITLAACEMAESYSEAEKTVVSSTGATGEELDAMMASATSLFASSHAENLNEVAAGMSAVKTATGLTGQALEEATNAGLVLNDVFGFELAESSRTASALMKNFGVTAEEAYNLMVIGAQHGANLNVHVLDVLIEYSAKVAYLVLSAEEFMSSLVDGADAGVFSVDKVGDAVKEFNIRAKDCSDTTAEAFELLGMNADVMTDRFAAGGETARAAFFEVVTALNEMDDPMQKNAAAVGLFGTMYEDLGVSLLSVLGNIEGGTLEMNDALGTVSKEAQSMGDRWKQAGNSISTAFSAAISPAVEKASHALAGFVEGIGEFLNEQPIIAKIISALAVGLGVATAATIAYTAAKTAAIPAIVKFGVTLNSALGPIGWIAIAVTAAVTAIGAFAAMMDNAEDETAGMTAITRAQYYELQDLNAEYEEACEKYGETSEEASRLKYEVDDLSAAFEANRQTVEEFSAEVDSLCESVDNLWSEFDSGAQDITTQETGTLALIQKYEDLSSKANLTAAQEEALETVTKKLSDSYPELAAQLDKTSGSAVDFAEAMREACEQQAEQQRQELAQDTYVEALMKQKELEEEIAKAEENLRLERQRVDDMGSGERLWQSVFGFAEMDTYQEKLKELWAAEDENNARLAEVEQYWDDLAEAEEAAADAPLTYQDAVGAAIESTRDEIDELCAAYDEVYQSALSSLEGQFGLFDQASMESEAYMNATVANAQAALDSQLAYWENYQANLEVLKNTSAADLGITQENYEALMAYAQGGTEEAAGLSASMAEAINSGNAEAVAELANTVGEVSAKQQEIAASTADWVTDFSSQMDAIEQKMQETVEGMNLSDEAAASASATIQSYISTIRNAQGAAVAAARSVALAVTAALQTQAAINLRVNTIGSVPGHAKGTTNAESLFLAGEAGPELVARPTAAYATGTTNSADYFIAGENGPELIMGEQGSTVFPTQETDRLIAALNEKRQPLQVFANTENSSESGRAKATEQVKRILLEIAGRGAIDITGGGGGVDKETILEILYDHLKPVLMNIIQSEIYEEGELAYDF